MMFRGAAATFTATNVTRSAKSGAHLHSGCTSPCTLSDAKCVQVIMDLAGDEYDAAEKALGKKCALVNQ